MKIAIVGAGLAGLALAFHLSQSAARKITIFDSKGVGGGASGIAAGLLYPYGGLHAKLNRLALEGLNATLNLISNVEKLIDKKIAICQGLLRQAFTEENLLDYILAAERYADVSLLSPSECQLKVPGVPFLPGIFIETCYTVNVKAYLEGLYEICLMRGVHLVQSEIFSLAELENYDLILIAAGAHVKPFADHISLTPLKGQLIKVKWPSSLQPLSTPLSSQAYILMDPSEGTAIIGATFERKYDSEGVDENFALADLMPKAIAMFPAIAQAEVMSCYAGIRASAPDYMPLIKQIDPRCWLLTGMGSKGLLYHALYAKKLIENLNP